MKAITELGEQTGLTGHQLSAMLGMSNSHFYRAMQGQREWPAAAIERLAAWQRQWQQVQRYAPAAPVLAPAELKACRQQLSQLDYRVQLAQRSYQQLQQRHARLRAQEAVLAGYMASTERLPPKERKRTELQLSQCRLRLRRCGPLQLLRAGQKLAGLSGQLAHLQQQLQAYGLPV